MTTFNIHNSRVEQLSDSGNNYKFAGKAETNAVSEKGNVVQTTGTGHTVQVDKAKDGFWSMLWGKIKAAWKWFFPAALLLFPGAMS
jgi:hypothetical protein